MFGKDIFSFKNQFILGANDSVLKLYYNIFIMFLIQAHKANYDILLFCPIKLLNN